MKIKISKSAIVFKITKEEARALNAGERVQEDIFVAGAVFSMTILPIEMEDSDDMGLKISWNKEAHCLTLFVDQSWVQYLIGVGKSKEGVAVNNGDLDVVLQIDLKTGRHPFKKK